MDAILTKSERETLKAIWRLTSRPDLGSRSPADSGARTGDLAASLNLSPGTMTATVKKLADRGLAVHTPYHGVELTEAGRRRAMSVVRRHRIVERFLADMLGYSWSEADRLAPTFEHQLPQEVEDRLYAALDRPSTCPHGFPIPEIEGADLPGMPPLYDLSPGDSGRGRPAGVDRPRGSPVPRRTRRPSRRGQVEVREKHPFDGPLVVAVDGHDRTIGEKVARQILVRVEPSNHKRRKEPSDHATPR